MVAYAPRQVVNYDFEIHKKAYDDALSIVEVFGKTTKEPETILPRFSAPMDLQLRGENTPFETAPFTSRPIDDRGGKSEDCDQRCGKAHISGKGPGKSTLAESIFKGKTLLQPCVFESVSRTPPSSAGNCAGKGGKGSQGC